MEISDICIFYLMRGVLFLIITFFACFSSEAQRSNVKENKPQETIHTEEYEASFPRGQDSLRRFLERKFIIPDPDTLPDFPGGIFHQTIIASFTIEKDGTPIDFKIITPVHPVLDKEWLRVLMSMPKWNPAMQNGRPVKAYKRQSITIDFARD